jgi:hypothetical protein
MADARTDLSSEWTTYEVCEVDEGGLCTATPFYETLTSSDGLGKAARKMLLIQELGWPDAKPLLKDSLGRPLVVKKDDLIWLLKCKPSCWRLYFYVWDKGKGIVYVHAVCKKQDKEDPADAKYARAIADSIRPGGRRITPFEFPYA